jgi:hypothetical protein
LFDRQFCRIGGHSTSAARRYVSNAKLGREEEVGALKRLDDQARRLERRASGPCVEELTGREQDTFIRAFKDRSGYAGIVFLSVLSDFIWTFPNTSSLSATTLLICVHAEQSVRSGASRTAGGSAN